MILKQRIAFISIIFTMVFILACETPPYDPRKPVYQKSGLFYKEINIPQTKEERKEAMKEASKEKTVDIFRDLAKYSGYATIASVIIWSMTRIPNMGKLSFVLITLSIVFASIAFSLKAFVIIILCCVGLGILMVCNHKKLKNFTIRKYINF